MRDHYWESNHFYELQLKSAEQITAKGGNLCGGVIDFNNPSDWIDDYTPYNFGGYVYFDLMGSFGATTTALEEWYDFLLKIHWGSASASGGFFQEYPFRFHLFDLISLPGTVSYCANIFGTSVLMVSIGPGSDITKPVSLDFVPFFFLVRHLPAKQLGSRSTRGSSCFLSF